MKALIVDNEPPVLEAMQKLIAAYCPEIHVVWTAGGVEAGVAAANLHQPDLIFTDVEMDDGTGMDMLKKLGPGKFQVVFITGHNKYAVEAFRFSAIDFLLKPVDPTELIAAVQKAKDHLTQSEMLDQYQVLRDHLDPNFQGEKRIVLRDHDNIHLVRVNDIIFCEAEGVYTSFYLVGGRKVIISKNLKEFEDLLEVFRFMRVHNSFLVNMSRAIGFSKAEGGHLILEPDHKIPVSKRKKDSLMEFFKSF